MAPHHGSSVSSIIPSNTRSPSLRVNCHLFPYLSQTELIFPNVSNYLRLTSPARWLALVFPSLGREEQANHRIVFGSFVALFGHSLPATGDEATCPRASPSLLLRVDGITLHTQMTGRSMLKHPKVCIISLNFYCWRNSASA